MRIDILHFFQLVVWYISFGKQYVHVTRHTTGNRVDGKIDFYPFGFQCFFKFVAGVLGLGYGKTITGYNHHALCIRTHDGGICDADFPDGETLHGFAAGAAGTECAADHIPETAVHRFTHQDSEDGSGTTYEDTPGEHDLVVIHKSTERGSNTGKGVEQRDNYWHVSTTDWHDKQDTIYSGSSEDEPDKPITPTATHREEDDASKYGKENRIVGHLNQLTSDVLDFSFQFSIRDHRTGE